MASPRCDWHVALLAMTPPELSSAKVRAGCVARSKATAAGAGAFVGAARMPADGADSATWVTGAGASEHVARLTEARNRPLCISV